MSDEDIDEELESGLIKAYLEGNQSYHLKVESPTHSPHAWPCSVWDTRPLRKDFCEKLILHGLIPKNYAIIKPMVLGVDDEAIGYTEES